MNYNKFFRLLVIGTMFFLVGCGNSSKTSTTIVAETTTPIPTENIDGGVVTEETNIAVEADNGTKLATVTLATGTEFQDENGNSITETPNLVVKAKKSTKSQAEISFATKDGTKVIPTEPVNVAIAAPAGAKPGDKVKIDVADGITAGAEKLTIFIVGNDGFIHVIIAPQVFRNVIIFIIVLDTVNPNTTGGQGGN